MKNEARLEIRINAQIKHQLECEAKLADMSLNTYVNAIIRYRKRMRVNVDSEKGRYLGY